MSETQDRQAGPPEKDERPPEQPPSDLDRPIHGDETEYIERGLKDEDKENRDD